jgi:hypothetical protein
VSRDRTYIKTFVVLYVVGTIAAAVFTTAGTDGAWKLGVWIAMAGTLLLGAYLGGRDYLTGSSATTAADT